MQENFSFCQDENGMRNSVQPCQTVTLSICFPSARPPPFFLGRKKQNKKKNLRKTASNRRASKDAGRQWTVNGKDFGVVSVWPDSFLLSSSSRHESNSNPSIDLKALFSNDGDNGDTVQMTSDERGQAHHLTESEAARRVIIGDGVVGAVGGSSGGCHGGSFTAAPSPGTQRSEPVADFVAAHSRPRHLIHGHNRRDDAHFRQLRHVQMLTTINFTLMRSFRSSTETTNNTSTQQSYLFLVATRQRNDAFLCFCFIQHLTLLSQWQYVLGERSNRHTHTQKKTKKTVKCCFFLLETCDL